MPRGQYPLFLEMTTQNGRSLEPVLDHSGVGFRVHLGDRSGLEFLIQ